MDAFLTASIMIQAPLLEVFDYVADPLRLPEWVPVYNDVRNVQRRSPESLSIGDTFDANFAIFPNVFGGSFDSDARLPHAPGSFSSVMAGLPLSVRVDDLVHGRRLSYRANVGWTTLCDFESVGGNTVMKMTQSMWSLPGLVSSYFMGPMQALYNEIYRGILQGLKRRLEGRAVEGVPRIFFSYRRVDARHVGGRIYDSLVAEFGRGTVFRDTDSLLAGGDWQVDIQQAIRNCKVVVVHIGDNWERLLVERRDGEDGLRDELEAALGGSTFVPSIIPVLTSDAEEQISVAARLLKLDRELEKVADVAPGIREKFTKKLQVQRLREDPDFSRDLEGLMRAVWACFRAPPT